MHVLSVAGPCGSGKFRVAACGGVVELGMEFGMRLRFAMRCLREDVA